MAFNFGALQEGLIGIEEYLGLIDALLNDDNEMGWSSESSSEDDEEDILYENDQPLNNIGELRRIPRVQNYIEEVIDNYTEEEFRQNFR